MEREIILSIVQLKEILQAVHVCGSVSILRSIKF